MKKRTITDHFKHKIKSINEIIDVTGNFPRKKKIILCHGVFDIVHPGHLRHLIYAKSKADYLVVSVTSDKYIDKGIYRPHVPENLRVANLAAFEIVVDGVDEEAVANGMAAAARAVAGDRILQIGAGNYGGELGKYHIHLHEVLQS